MKKNMGFFDQFLRGLIAIGLIAMNAKGLVYGRLALAAVIIAIVFILTGIFGFCPVYAIFGISSRKTS